MTNQDLLVSLLKQKGTGKTMSKSLDKEQCEQVLNCFASAECSDVTKTTLWTALMMLKNTDEEQTLLNRLNTVPFLPQTCKTLLENPSTEFQKILNLLLKHQSLNETDMQQSITRLFDPIVNTKNNDCEKAVFLEGLRLKEETNLENQAMLHYYWHSSQRAICDVPILIDLSTAYDGFNRHPQLALFTAPLLASIGFNVVLHGCEEVSPKRGINPYKLLQAAGKNPTKSLEQVKTSLETNSIAWGYCDQRIFFPEADALRPLRQLIVKRPLLATIEKFCQPLVSKHRTVLITGYTHPPYRQKTINLLQKLQSFGHLDTYIILRGLEGSCTAPQDRRCPIIIGNQSNVQEDFVSPADFGLNLHDRIEPNPEINVTDTLDLGLKALSGQSKNTQEQLIYNCLLILSHANLIENLEATKKKLQDSISSGKALSHWDAY
jgi:anthranilate phosphoribosyltransferase